MFEFRNLICIIILYGSLTRCSYGYGNGSPINSDINPRIINGTNAILENTKHQMSIRLYETDFFFGTGHICGGVLISPNAVLTSATCFYRGFNQTFRSAKEFKIIGGTLDKYNQTGDVKIYRTTNYEYPKNFNYTNVRDDIGIIFLNESVPINHPAIQKIYRTTEQIPAGTICQVTGWGVKANDRVPEFLQTIDVAIIDQNQCKSSWGKNFTNGMICAGYMKGEYDACGSDTGGPLVCNGKLVGIVSKRSGNISECARPGYPGLYTDVLYYREWINDVINGSTPLSFQQNFVCFILTLIFFIVRQI